MMTATLDTRAIAGTEKAYLYARSGIARSGATRSNYVQAFTSVDLIERDESGAIISRIDLVPYVRHGSLQVSQALNDEADTCSFQIVPTAPAAAVPKVGQELAVAWTPGNVLFQGYALTVQFDRRAMNESPWVSVQCQDFMWRFDARIVTYGFPSQSVSASIAFLVAWFVNDPEHPSPNDFTVDWVQPNMPTLPAFEVINQRPSTVMRRLTATVQGAFYLDGRHLHAWAGSLAEPQQPVPQPLTNDLLTLKTFRVTHDATQLRKRVLVEGRRTASSMPIPPMADASATMAYGIPVGDATTFSLTGYPSPPATTRRLARFGSQWVFLHSLVPAGSAHLNSPQSTVAVAYDPNPGTLLVVANMPNQSVPSSAWIRVAGQFSMYTSATQQGAGGVWHLTLPPRSLPYGLFTNPLPVGTIVDWVDSVLSLDTHGLLWSYPVGTSTPGDRAVRAEPVDAPMVVLAEADRPLEGWPPIEGFVQDGRYRYEGAQARAEADLDAFAQPLVTAEWETDDLNAAPGRVQAINLTGSSVIDPLVLSVTITQVDITFPLRTLPPRRRCVAGDVKPSTFLDLVLTDES